jgi:hypothetical protein
LLTYFPASQTKLDTALADSLSTIPDGKAKEWGVRYGRKAADRIVQLRTGDGRDAPLTFDTSPAPGVWRPTAPTFSPFFIPWLSQVHPLMLTSASQFRPGGPPAMTSAKYTKEFNEVRDYGAKAGSKRTAGQTETALFFSDIAGGPLQASLRDLVTRHGFGISESARLFAAADMSIADSVATMWDTKYHYGFWRPITAIQRADEDGNAKTLPVDDWEPLLTTPPYPDYASGLNSVMSSFSRVIDRLVKGKGIDVNITSVAAGSPGSPLTRHYDTRKQLTGDAIDARVWSGIHFRTADVVAFTVATQVADWGLDHYFQRENDCSGGHEARS